MSTTTHTCRGAVFCGFPEAIAVRDCPACTPLPEGWTYHPQDRATGAWSRTVDGKLLMVYRLTATPTRGFDAGWTWKVKRLDGSGQVTTTQAYTTAADAAEHLELEELGR